MKRQSLSKISFNLLTGAMQVIFLAVGLLSLTGMVIFNFGLTFRGFAFIWCLVYLILITSVLRKQVKDNPESKQRAVLNWSFATFFGIALTMVFMAFIL